MAIQHKDGTAAKTPEHKAAAARKRPRRRWHRAATLVVGVLIALIVLEFSAQLAVRAGWLSTPRPRATNPDPWFVDHDVFGIWRRPNAVMRYPAHDVEYRTNSVGARDRQRDVSATGPRVVVLGDSFTEGWRLPVQQRFSNLLERSTGREHLNFALAHHGPYQYYLVYRELGKRYEHSHVLVSLLPVNDFVDIDYESARKARWYDFRYRPYLVGDDPHYRHLDHRESGIPRFLRDYSYAYNALGTAYIQLRPGAVDEYTRPLHNEAGLVQSRFHAFTERQFDLLRHCLELLVGEAATKRVAVVLIPSQKDFLRYEESGSGPLAGRLTALGSQHGFRVVDLMPAMHEAASDSNTPWKAYYFRNDYHWNARGNAVAAEILRRELQGFIY